MTRKSFLRRTNYLESIGSRMMVATVALFVLFALALWAFRQTTLQTRLKLKEAVWVYTPMQTNTQKIQIALEQYKQNVQDIALTTDTSQRAAKWVRIEKIWKQAIQPYQDSIEKHRLKAKHSFLQNSYKSMIFKLQKHEKYLDKLKRLVTQGHYTIYLPTQTAGVRRLYLHDFVSNSLSIHILPLLNEINEIAIDCEEKIHTFQVAQEFDDQNVNFFTSWVFWLMWIIGVLACLWWLWQIREMHAEDMELMRRFPQIIQKGDIPTPIEPLLLEHKQLAHTLNTLIRPLTELRDFAQEIHQEENQTAHLQLFGKRGELGKALTQMREGLSELAQENEIRNITNTGLAKFAEIFAKYASNLTQLSDAFIAHLVNYLNANQGGLFLLETQDGRPYLELKASFAYDQKRYSERIVEPGQGLIGQVWKEGETTYLREIPPFYVNITSGLGEATPTGLLIVPLKANNTVLGVVEVASFREILPFQRIFVEKVADNLAQVIANSQQAEQTKYLLQESQALAHNLQAREEELKEKMNDLQIAQHVMESTQGALKEKENNLQGLINNTSHAIVAFDRLYRVTVINKVMRQMYLELGIVLEVGKNMLEEIPQTEFVKRHKDFFRVLGGEKFVTLERVDRVNQILYYELHYNPILNAQRQVLGASIFIENITQQKMAEVYLKETEANLNSLINNTEDAILALDKSYNILVFNEVYAKQSAERGYAPQREKSIFDYLPTDKQGDWRDYFNRALLGERFAKITDSGKFPNKIYYEHWFNPILEDNIVTGLSIFTRNITETRKAEIQSKQVLLESLEEAGKFKQYTIELEKQIADYQRKIEYLQSSAQ